MVKSRESGVESRLRLDEVLGRATAERAPSKKLGPFISVSRQLGSGGAEVANLAGKRLGFKVLDRELVEQLAEQLEVSPRMLQLMDETRSNWFRDAILSLVEPRLVEQASYVGMLGKVMLLAAYDGKVVFVGRGANFLLPPKAGLRVLVVGSRADRMRRVREREGLDLKGAERRLAELDQGRADYIRRNFYADVNDPAHYDLVVDTSAFGVDGAVDLVVKALELKGAKK